MSKQEKLAREKVRSLDSAKARQIIAGGKQTFMELGFEGASTEEITRRANVSKATLYAYFPTKEQLFEFIVREECERQAIAILAQIDASRPIEDLLRELTRGFIRLLLTPAIQNLHRVAIGEAKRFPELARAFYDSGPGAGKQRLAGLLETYVARGELNIEDTLLAAVQLEQLVKAEFINKVLFGIQTEYTEQEIGGFSDRAVSAFLAIYQK